MIAEGMRPLYVWCFPILILFSRSAMRRTMHGWSMVIMRAMAEGARNSVARKSVVHLR